jgi:hypothetical protein
MTSRSGVVSAGYLAPPAGGFDAGLVNLPASISTFFST